MNYINRIELSLSQRVKSLNWRIIGTLVCLMLIGFLMLYSAGSGSFRPWLIRQIAFVALFFPIMILIAVLDIKFWYKKAYLIYIIGLVMLIVVDVIGHTALGATRWLRIGSFTLQPSEIMKVCTVLALARYFNDVEIEDVRSARYLAIPFFIIATPVLLIFDQPDLGTASILLFVGVLILFVAGVKLWKFIVVGLTAIIAIPFLWIFALHEYQKQRIITFINPNNDPLGSGYNIIQSKIAIGSGGIFGKGYLNGTQGQLDFLPEKQTDFIFTMLSEELGLIGCLITISLYCFLIFLSTMSASKISHQYGRLLVIGVINILFIHMFINIGMTSGILPVVGAPLPLISYGGTITATMLIGFGLALNADLYKDSTIR